MIHRRTLLGAPAPNPRQIAPTACTSAGAMAFIRAEPAEWTPVVRASGATPV